MKICGVCASKSWLLSTVSTIFPFSTLLIVAVTGEASIAAESFSAALMHSSIHSFFVQHLAASCTATRSMSSLTSESAFFTVSNLSLPPLQILTPKNWRLAPHLSFTISSSSGDIARIICFTSGKSVKSSTLLKKAALLLISKNVFFFLAPNLELEPAAQIITAVFADILPLFLIASRKVVQFFSSLLGIETFGIKVYKFL